MLEVDVYWHTRKRVWSIRIDGRVALHERETTLAHVRLVVRLPHPALAQENGKDG